MAAFLGISIWVTLAMVVPGLVTMAALFGAMATTGGLNKLSRLNGLSEWVTAGIAVTCMIMTQAIGVLRESLLVTTHWMGTERRPIAISAGIDPLGERKLDLQPYEEYQGLYLLLAELREDEDSHGHLQRTLAQFFLSNSTIVWFGSGILLTLCRLTITALPDVPITVGYLGLLCAFLVITVRVSRIRFEVVTKTLWAARRRRLKDADNARSACRGGREGETPRHRPHRLQAIEQGSWLS